MPANEARDYLLIGDLLTTAGQAAGHKPTEISVGYFLQRPTPAQFSQATQTFDNALGLRVNWLPFPGPCAFSAWR
jgi:taurine transport system substrate-binding protein